MEPQVIVVERKEGCFLRTLNCGCLVALGFVLLIALLGFVGYLSK